MNLKVYDKEGKFRNLNSLQSLTLEFDRNTFSARYRAGNGMMTHEEGELHTLFPQGESPYFVFDNPAVEGDEVKLGIVGNKGSKSARSVSSGVGHLVDPTSIPTGNLTKSEEKTDDLKKTHDDEGLKRIQERLKEINEKESKDKPKEQPKSFSVPVASAVGTLVDPGSQETGQLNKEGNLSVPNAPENKQGTTKFEINK